MKYNVIRINAFQGEWDVSWRYDDTDRCYDEGASPHAMGFYWCPETIALNDGFVALKNKMINRHKEEINSLQKSMDELEKLEFPSDDRES
jgi:hypothetical protein